MVDGGNSRWTDDQANAAMLGEKGIGFVDCGVSGGVWGLENGYALMYGGSADDVAKVQPAFDALKPEGEFGSVHAGSVGAGHFSKMVHNGIEYAVMQAYAEGWEAARQGRPRRQRARGVPVLARGHGDPSWLLDLLVAALDEDPEASKIRGYADDSVRAGGPWRPASTTRSRPRPSPQPSTHGSSPARTTPRP